MSRVNHVHLIAVICTDDGRVFAHETPPIGREDGLMGQLTALNGQRLIDNGQAKEFTGQELTIASDRQSLTVEPASMPHAHGGPDGKGH